MHYYNEIDPYAAAWLRNLIEADVIPAGHVDTRDIRDVLPSDLAGYTACHFFAGLGGWAYALRLAGWPDDRPVWTGSCPCQPFSAAGKGAGFADERHLWPAWFWLLVQCQPDVVFGEQVDKALDWLDLVATDLEGEGYAIGSGVVPAAGGGAPHGRHRLWFVADTAGERRARERLLLRPEESGRDASGVLEIAGSGEVGNVAESDRARTGRDAGTSDRAEGSMPSARNCDGRGRDAPVACGAVRDLGDPHDPRLQGWRIPTERARELFAGAPGLGGFWSACDWIYCRDGKYRPVEPGTFPLAHGVPARVGRLRAYGNAIVPRLAAEFIRAYDPTLIGTPTA